MNEINLLQGDCLELMKAIPDKSIDMVLTDPPYGTTACKWDTVVPFEPMWEELKRIIKDNGAICLFGSEPFSSALRMSNIKMFKYDWVWHKNRYTNHLNAKKQPVKSIETVSVFYKKQCRFDRIPFEDREYAHRSNKTSNQSSTYSDFTSTTSRDSKKIKVARDYLNFKTVHPQSKESVKHPTQKPVALLENLIKTYTLENEAVLDFTMGSGSTGVACKNLNRKFIGIEKDEKYFQIAKDRIYGQKFS